MKKFISTLISYLLTPALLYGHYVTGNSSFIFLYMLLALLVLLMYPFLGTFYAIMRERNQAEYKKMIIALSSSSSPFTAALSWVYFIGAFSYLTYAHCFFTATLCLVASLEGIAFRYIIKDKAKKFMNEVGK